MSSGGATGTATHGKYQRENESEREEREERTPHHAFSSIPAEQHVKALRVFALPVLPEAIKVRLLAAQVAALGARHTVVEPHASNLLKVRRVVQLDRGEEELAACLGRARRAEHRGERSAVAAVV